MRFGSKEGTVLKDLTFERATDTGALSSFSCGQEDVDRIIQNSLDEHLPMNDLYLVRDGEEVIALFCIGKEKHSLFLSDSTKERMLKGSKPKPDCARKEGESYWERFTYDSREVTLLAVKNNRRGKHIGSFIMEHIIEMLSKDPSMKSEFLIVRALNVDGYTAIPFYRKCGFFPAKAEISGENLIMYRVIPRNQADDIQK